jgi:hypothetical protein
MASGDLFEDGFVTWSPNQAKSFFRAGMVEDFVCSRVLDHWALMLVVVGRAKAQERFVAVRSARETDKTKYRHFKTLDAAVNAAAEIGFDCRHIGPARVGHKEMRRSLDVASETIDLMSKHFRGTRQGRPQGGEAQP